jgi:hypothetical protein
MEKMMPEKLDNLIKKEVILSNDIRENSIIIEDKVSVLFKEKKIENEFSSIIIYKNAVQCKLCETIAVSEHGHHFAPCRCTFNHADGGNGYLRRSGCHAHEVSICTYEEIKDNKEINLLIKEQLDKFNELKTIKNTRFLTENETRFKLISSFVTLLLTKESYINLAYSIEFFLKELHRNEQNLPKSLPQLTFRKFEVDFGERKTSYEHCDESSAIINYLFSNKYYQEEEFEDYKDRDWDNRNYFISKGIPKEELFKNLNISMEALVQYQNIFNISYDRYLKTKKSTYGN